MADDIDIIEIGGTWTDLTTLAPVVAGEAVLIQNLGAADGAIANVGTPNAVIEITTRETAPPSAFTGVHCLYNKMFKVDAGEPKIWLKFSRLGHSNVGVLKCNVKVQRP